MPADSTGDPDVFEAFGAMGLGQASGAAVGDQRNRVYIGDGQGGFTLTVAGDAQLSDLDTQSAAFGDVDGDGASPSDL